MRSRPAPSSPGTLLLVALLALPAALDAACTAGARRIQVPEECTTIGSAVTALADGGTIDLAPGTYTFGTGGLNLSGKNKAMTLAARVAGGVTFSGQGLYPVVKVSNSASNGEPIVFEGIRFVDGYSSSGFQAGGVTLKNAEVSFVDCEFANHLNEHLATGGGALGLYGGSRALIVRTSFTDNRAKNQGGALYVYTSPTDGPSSAWIHDSSFERNSTAAAGFTVTAAGGAIYARNARLVVADTRFADNVAGWVGGAIYLWGAMAAAAPYCDYGAPSADLLVARSSFEGNRADDSAGESSVPQTQGGAIHAENCVRLRLFGSLFEENGADWGGAISLDHAWLSAEQTRFRHNYSSVPSAADGYPIGGALMAHAIDNGADNLPNGAVTLVRTLFEGRRLGDGGAVNSQIGGCLMTIGDGSEPLPVGAAARIQVSITDSAFFDCAVDQYSPALGFVGGGAVDLDRSTLSLVRVLFARSTALGAPGGVVGNGSGLSAREDSRVSFGADVVFAGGTTDGPDGDLYLSNGSSTSGAFTSFGASQTNPVGGMLVAAPSRPSPGGPFAGEAGLTWGWAGSAAALDGESVSDTPRNGSRTDVEGSHVLAVDGLASCARCAATIAPPLYPSTTLEATPDAIAAGETAALAWATPSGTPLAALVDRGIGETAATGDVAVSPGGSATYRRFVVTAEGGALAEERVYVDEQPPSDTPLFASGFEGGLSGWSSVSG